MEENIKTELETLTNLSEAERDENQQNRFKELNSWAEAEKTAEEKSKDLQSAIAQKEHFRTKHEETQKELDVLKGGKPLGVKPEVSEEWIASNDPLEIVRLGKTLQGFDEKETEFIIRNAPTRDIEGIIKSSQDEWVKTAIEAKGEKVVKENKIPSPSSPSGITSRNDASKAVSEGNVAEAAAKKEAELEAKEGRRGGI